MTKANLGLHKLENDNLADLPGVLKYFHTEVIAESHVGDWDRQSRKYGIDVIARWDFKVKNVASMLTDVSPNVNLQDFGPFVTYDFGQSTNDALDSVFSSEGDFVGAQLQRDPRFKFEDPFYWFSISGFCPNLPFVCTDDFPGCAAHDPAIFTARCGSGGCPAKGDVWHPNAQCLRLHGGSVLLGGSCEEPEGVPGCTYSYKNEQTVSLDVLAGITQESCGGRVCEDWQDFRRNCANASYRRKFDTASGRVEEFKYCVEYDIHPFCSHANACDDPLCLALAPAERELGLPFWKGRCNAKANRMRAEVLASSFGILGGNYEHREVTQVMRRAQFDTPCDREGAPLACRANPAFGGTYCTRFFSGVCSSCYIPGTKNAYPIPDEVYCPYDILSSPDYVQLEAPTCKSQNASDLCCLYSQNCEGDEDPAAATLDLDGFFLVSALLDTEKVLTWLNRYIEEKMGRVVGNEEQVREVAYWLWDHKPLRDVVLWTIEDMLNPFLIPTANGEPQVPSNLPDSPKAKKHGGMHRHQKFFIIGATVVMCVFVAVLICFWRLNHEVQPPQARSVSIVELNTRPV